MKYKSINYEHKELKIVEHQNTNDTEIHEYFLYLEPRNELRALSKEREKYLLHGQKTNVKVVFTHKKVKIAGCFHDQFTKKNPFFCCFVVYYMKTLFDGIKPLFYE